MRFIRAAAFLCLLPALAFAAVEMPAASYLKGLTWLGHSSFRLERGGAVVYLDPWNISAEPHDAGLILISHPHFDHCDPASVAKIAGADATVVTVKECADKLREAGWTGPIREIKPGDKLEVKGVRLEAVPAYNLNKPHHPQEKQWVGFVLEVDGVRIYHAGDTDFIPEMKEIQADAALLPVSGTYVMTAEEAAEAAKAMNPKVAVPMHYGSLVGTKADAERFRALCGGVIVEILEKSS